MSQAPVDVLTVGMVTPVGLTAPTTAAAIRAGISRVAESSLFCRGMEPQAMGLLRDSSLPELRPSLRGGGRTGRHMRMLRLATWALYEALQDLPRPPPLVLALPDSPLLPGAIAHSFLDDLAVQVEVPIELARSEVLRNGRAGALWALARALELLPEFGVVVVGGVDSHFDLRLLDTLARRERLFCGRQSDGFVPGEAAAFLVLATPAATRRLGRAPLAQILAVGKATEAGHHESELPHLGDGLAEAVQAVCFAAPPAAPPVTRVYTGLNGEHVWGKDWGVACLRSAERLDPAARVLHPVEFIGDPGAALGAVLASLAALDAGHGDHQGSSLVWCATDLGERGAALMGPAATGRT